MRRARPTDALEDMRQHCERFRYQHDACGKCHVCIAIAAWEKERAEAIEVKAQRDQFAGAAIMRANERDALRAALERIEREMRPAIVNGIEWGALRRKVKEWADELRAAREPNRPQGSE